MKYSPKIYAETLIESVNNNNLKEVAVSLWHTLQKNKQYKDLPKILELLDEEYAKRNNIVLVKVYSEEKLDEKQLNEIKNQLSLRAIGEAKAKQSINSNVQYSIINIPQKNAGGITIKIDDKVIDLSTESKLNKLKQIINK